jgi:uncharacterized protein YdeI (YjbR/CyaY-like superfamily)
MPTREPEAPRFFPDPQAWRRWLEAHHDGAAELWVGFYKKGSGRPSITWPEAVDGALCFGWIDGVRKGIDGERYKIRFTPRRRGSIWSDVNVRRAAELAREGLMRPAGQAAFDARTAARSGVYAYEQRQGGTLDPAHEASFRANEAAWAFFQSRPPSYQRTAIWWVVSAKQEATRLGRLAALIDDSAHGRTIAQLTRPAARKRPLD